MGEEDQFLDALRFGESRQLYVPSHEVLLIRPQEILKEIAKKFSIRIECELDLLLDGYAKQGTEPQQGSDLIDRAKPFDHQSHIERRWNKDFPKDAVELVVDTLQGAVNRHPILKEKLDPEALSAALDV